MMFDVFSSQHDLLVRLPRELLSNSHHSGLHSRCFRSYPDLELFRPFQTSLKLIMLMTELIYMLLRSAHAVPTNGSYPLAAPPMPSRSPPPVATSTQASRLSRTRTNNQMLTFFWNMLEYVGCNLRCRKLWLQKRSFGMLNPSTTRPRSQKSQAGGDVLRHTMTGPWPEREHDTPCGPCWKRKAETKPWKQSRGRCCSSSESTTKSRETCCQRSNSNQKATDEESGIRKNL